MYNSSGRVSGDLPLCQISPRKGIRLSNTIRSKVFTMTDIYIYHIVILLTVVSCDVAKS
jgi:hypothetical protein